MSTLILPLDFASKPDCQQSKAKHTATFAVHPQHSDFTSKCITTLEVEKIFKSKANDASLTTAYFYLSKMFYPVHSIFEGVE